MIYIEKYSGIMLSRARLKCIYRQIKQNNVLTKIFVFIILIVYILKRYGVGNKH